MESRVARGMLVVAGSVVGSLLLMGLLNLILPGCSDIVNEGQSILCMGGLGEPIWKPPLVFLFLTLVSGTAMWLSVGTR